MLQHMQVSLGDLPIFSRSQKKVTTGHPQSTIPAFSMLMHVGIPRLSGKLAPGNCLGAALVGVFQAVTT